MRKTHKKRRSTWVDISVTLFIFTLILGGVYFFFIISNKSSASSPPKQNSNQIEFPVITDMVDSNYPGIKIITKISNDPTTPFALQYPQSIHKKFNEEINVYVNDSKDNYLKQVSEYTALGEEISGELNISFETFLHQSGIYSFVLVNNTFVGDDDTNGTTEIISFRLHPETGEKITINDIFENDIARLDHVSTAARHFLLNDKALEKNLLVDEVNKHTEPLWHNFENFALLDDAIIFYFDKYQGSSDVSNIPIASIPISEINSLVAKDFKLPLITDDKTNSETNEKANSDSVEQDNETAKYSENSNEEVVDEETNSSETKKVALTFDDGPDPKVTIQILASLDKYDAKATFFMLGSRVEYYPEIAKSVADAGHELGNHTWNHHDLTKVSIKKINKELTRTSSIIEKVTGKKAISLRPPYGAVNNTVRDQTNLPVILWDVDTNDWKYRNANQLLSHIKKHTKDGSIVLMHDIHQSTADGLDAVLAYLASEGYTFVTVSEIEE